MTILTAILSWALTNKKKLFKAILSLSVALLICFGISTYKENKKLSERLEIAQNNIETYQGSLAGSQQANNVLKLDIEQLRNTNDKLLHDIDSVREELKIKPKQVTVVATQTQTIYVNNSKEITGNIIDILKDSIYTDSIRFNDQTAVKYSISKDTVNIALNIQNKQFLYVYNTREYKNKKNFFKRLITLDFKKVNKCKYQIVNTNDLINTDSVRVVEQYK